MKKSYYIKYIKNNKFTYYKSTLLSLDLINKSEKVILKNISLITKKSLNNKIWLILNNVWKYFFFNINKYIPTVDEYVYKNYFYFNLSINPHLYDVYFLNLWVLDLLKPAFFIKCTKVDKKYKKFLKTSYLYKIKYLKTNFRYTFSYRNLASFILYNNYLNIRQKILYSYIDLFLNYKNSKIYKQKFLIYNKIFKFL